MLFRCLIALGMLSVACNPSLRELADDHAKQTGLAYAECGDVALPRSDMCVETTVDDCLVDALATCTPSRASVSRPSVEGDRIPTVVFVEPEGDGCVVFEIIDTTRDRFGSKSIDRFRCNRFVDDECFLANPGNCNWVETYFTS